MPWLSFALLFSAYSSFSWFLYNATVSWIAWSIVLSLTLLEALLLTTFSRGLRSLIRGWLTSDIGYFATVICAAFLAAIALVWIKIFSYILTVLAAELLARLELQRLQYGRWQAFWVLTSVSFAGLAVGLGADYFFDN